MVFINIQFFNCRYISTIYPYLFQGIYGFMGIARTGSVYMTMAITLERYFAIVKPLASFTCKNALGPLTLAFAIAWNVPRFFEWKIMILNNNGNWTDIQASKDNWTEFEIHESNFRKGINYSLYYRMWFTFIVIEAIPYLTIIVLNAIILRKIVKSYTFRRSFTERGKHRTANVNENEEHQMAAIEQEIPSQRNIEGLKNIFLRFTNCSRN